MALDLDRFLSDCVTAVAESSPVGSIRDAVTRAVSDPHDLVQALGSPKRAQVQRLLVSV